LNFILHSQSSWSRFKGLGRPFCLHFVWLLSRQAILSRFDFILHSQSSWSRFDGTIMNIYRSCFQFLACLDKMSRHGTGCASNETKKIENGV